MNLLLTGSATDFAQALLPQLLADEDISLVIGVDAEDSGFRHERFVQVIADLRSPQLARPIKGMHAVVHLAQPLLAERGTERMEMLRGTQNLFTLAQANKTRRLVHLSSALIYETRAGGETITGGNVTLDEDAPRGAEHACPEAVALQTIEDWLDEFETTRPRPQLLRLRPHWMLGPHSHSLVARLLRRRLLPRLPEPAPRLQAIHEIDVMAAILLALRTEERGAFNLACSESGTFATLARDAHWLRLTAGAELTARRAGVERGCQEILRRSLLLSGARARNELGWKPRFNKLRDIVKGR